MSNAPAGWYPTQEDPSLQRYWDGQAWTEHVHRVQHQPVAAPPPPAAETGYGHHQTPQDSRPDDRPFYQKKRFNIPAGLVGLLVVLAALGMNSDDDGPQLAAVDEAAEQEEAADAEAASVDGAAGNGDDGADQSAPPDATVESVDGAEPGSTDNPIPLGQAHSRDAGLLGAGWTISVDEIRVDGIPLDPIFAEDGETRSCIAVIGTAVLDSLDSEELTSNPFSFPQIVVVSQGSKAESAIAECDASGLRSEGLEWTLDVSLAPGGETKWFDVFLVPDGSYDTVAVESTVYAAN